MTTEVSAEAAVKAAETKAALEKPAAELTNKDLKFRERYKDTVQELEQTKIKAEKAEKALAEAQAATVKEKERIYQDLLSAKLEAAAVAAGLNDLDLVKLIDMSSVKVNDAGQAEGIKEAVEAFKAKKPAYFGEQKKTSSSTNASVGTSEAKILNAHDLKRDEFFEKFRITPKS